MTIDIIYKALDDGLEAIDCKILAPAFAQMLLDADGEIAKGNTRLGELLAEFKKLVGDTTDTQKVLTVAFNSVEGRRVAQEIARILRPDNMSKCDGAAVGARARLVLSPTARIQKARAGASWGATWKAEGVERLRQLVLNDLLADQVQTRATFWKSDEGKAIYGMIHAPAAELTFDAAVEQLETTAPGWIDDQLAKLGGNVEKADSAIAKIAAKAKLIRKADPKLTPEQARAEAWRRNPDLYKQQRRERARAAR